MLRRTRTAHKQTQNIDDTIVVLPDGISQIVNLQGLENFSDLKCRLELLYGIPYELQRLFLSDTEYPVGDWVPLNTLQDERAVFVKTEKSWLTFFSACLRQKNSQVLQILDELNGAVVIENRIFVAFFISLASTNIELIESLNKRVQGFKVFNKRTASGRNLLHVAIASFDWECTELILKHASLDLLLAEDCSGQTPISIAENSHNYYFIEKVRAYYSKQKMEESVKSFKPRKEVTRHRASHSLKFSVEKQLKVTERNTRSQSTPTSPFEKSSGNRVLERQALSNSLDNLECANRNQSKEPASSSKVQPLLELEVSKSSASIFLDPATAARKSPRSLSPSPRISPTYNPSIRRKSTQSISAPVSPNPVTFSDNKTLPPSPANSDNRCKGLQQVVFLPPWRRTGGNRLDTNGTQTRRISIANTKSITEYQNSQRRESTVDIKRPAIRSLSVACKLTSEDLQRLESHERLHKPWNEWRRLSVVPKSDQIEPQNIPKDEHGATKKTFEEWFIDKENEREANLAKMTEEERRREMDKERQEQQRRMRCKSYDEWLLEKEVQSEISKEEEKEKESEKQIEAAKIEDRKAEAERKYQKWMMEKYEEELRKEEELEKLMKEKWKMKQQTKERRKSIATMKLTDKRPLTSSKSLPIV